MNIIRTTFFVLISPFLVHSAFAEMGIGGLNLNITQQGKAINAEKTDNYIFRLGLAKAPFEIHYGAQDLGVCVSTNPAVFEKANNATDTMSDFTSCLFMFKAFGMSAEGGELIVDMDGASWLNLAHGARKEQGNRYVYSVGRFTGKETGDLELTKVSQPVYLVFWDDRDKNKTIDVGEVARVKLVFK